jgi:hypothetical protein
VMSSSCDSSFSEIRHHHHHHSDLQHCGSSGKLDCHSWICHGMGSQQDLVLPGECCNMLERGGDLYGSHGYLPMCNCQAEQQCRRRRVCKVSFRVDHCSDVVRHVLTMLTMGSTMFGDVMACGRVTQLSACLAPL